MYYVGKNMMIIFYESREVEAGLMEYKPDIIISVHARMQHVPLWVLKWQGLQKKVIFVTMITDLNSCHRTWFHPSVNRCYCPSEELAKRASLDGLEDLQIRVYGLPVRPSFARVVHVKVGCLLSRLVHLMHNALCICKYRVP
ncbi:hypothetical protein Droror1_Dr00023916 [Drosera rotundifolia]